jgi:hypothetical protein
MCLLAIQLYKCGHEKARSLAMTYVLDGKVKVCHVEINDALNRSCSNIVTHKGAARYKCARCLGSLNWSKDYAETNGWYGERYLKDSSHA